MTKRDFVAAAAGALVASALAGGVAWAAIPDSGGVIQGCYNSGGNLKVVSELPCPKGYTSLPWNQQGPTGDPGADGVSPTVTQLGQGDVSCPDGGVAITDASGSTAHVCNGAAGADGQSFAGTFTSPNGEYSISVTDTGITLSHGPTTSIKLAGNALDLRSVGGTEVRAGTTAKVEAGLDLALRSGTSAEMRAGTSAKVHAGSDFTIEGGTTGLVQSTGVLNLKGSTINLN